MKENRRKCFKCGVSPYDNPAIFLHRFPKPGRTNSLRCELWAKYCSPHDSWHSPEFQNKLYSEHRMLCTKHFKGTYFIDTAGKSCELWAKNCFPNEAWSSPKFQDRLHSKHKMLCSKHFKITFFIEKKLFRTAVPDVQCHKEYAGQSRINFVEDEKSADSNNDKSEHKIEDNVEDDGVISEPQLFSWQKDSEVNCDDLNYDSDNPTEQKTTSNVNQAEYCNIEEPCTSTENTSNDEREGLHEGYKCDMCEGPIYKFRYTCLHCVNYDLCGDCEGRTAHAQHYLLRVPRHRPYGEIQQVMDTIRRILTADIESFQTEANFANNFLDEMKSEVVSETETDPCPEELEYPILMDDSRHEEDVEMCSYSSPSPNRSIAIASQEPKTQTDEEKYEGKATSTPQTHSDHVENEDSRMCTYPNPPSKLSPTTNRSIIIVSHEHKTDEGIVHSKATSTPQTHSDHVENEDDPDIDWLDEDILEAYETSHQSCNAIENIIVKDGHDKLINKDFHSQLKPVRRKLYKMDNRLSPSNVPGKVNKKMLHGVVKLQNVTSNSTGAVKVLKTFKHSLESKVCINMKRLSDEEIKLAENI